MGEGCFFKPFFGTLLFGYFYFGHVFGAFLFWTLFGRQYVRTRRPGGGRLSPPAVPFNLLAELHKYQQIQNTNTKNMSSTNTSRLKYKYQNMSSTNTNRFKIQLDRLHKYQQNQNTNIKKEAKIKQQCEKQPIKYQVQNIWSI